MNNTELTTKIVELNNQLNAAKKELCELFKSEFVKLFEESKNKIEGYTLKSIDMGCNNHSFNDGDATYFSLYHEDLHLSVRDESRKTFKTNHDSAAEKLFQRIEDDFRTLFDEFDVAEIYEMIVEDAYETVSFSVQDGKFKYGS